MALREKYGLPEPPVQRAVERSMMSRTTLRIAGSIILAVGIGSAAFIHRNAQPPPVEVPYSDDLYPLDSRKYGHDQELYSGKVGVLMDKWIRFAKELEYSEPFARGVAVVSVAAGIACFVAAGRRA